MGLDSCLDRMKQQAEALRNRIVSAKLMLENIETGTETRDSKV